MAACGQCELPAADVHGRGRAVRSALMLHSTTAMRPLLWLADNSAHEPEWETYAALLQDAGGRPGTRVGTLPGHPSGSKPAGSSRGGVNGVQECVPCVEELLFCNVCTCACLTACTACGDVPSEELDTVWPPAAAGRRPLLSTLSEYRQLQCAAVQCHRGSQAAVEEVSPHRGQQHGQGPGTGA